MELNSHRNNSNLPVDKWDLKLKERLREIKSCQNNRGLNSCFDCFQLLNCNIRDSYVHAVYSSMNRGSGGGFEF
jgi:hypothetical protein